MKKVIIKKPHKNKRYFWSEKEIEILKKYGSILTPKKIQSKLDKKSIAEIYKQRSRLNITGPYLVSAWTNEELKKLKKIGHKYKAKDLVKFFKNKSELKITRMRTKLGIKVDHTITYNSATKDEIKIIKNNLHLEDKAIVKLLKGRTRSFVISERLKLGLTKRDQFPPFPKYFNKWFDKKLNRNKSLNDFVYKTGNKEILVLKCPINPQHLIERTVENYWGSYERLQKVNCPYCKGKHTVKEIRKIVSSLIDALPYLNEQQRWVFFQQTGLLDGNNKFKNLMKAVVANKFPLSELQKFVEEKKSLVDEFADDRHITTEEIGSKLNITDDNNIDKKDTSIDDEKENNVNKIETINSKFKKDPIIPTVKSRQFLKAIDKTTNLLQSDREAVDYLLISGTDILWKDVYLRNNEAVKEIKNFKGGKYVNTIKNNFLSEYNQAISLKIPKNYSSHKPNLMQKLTAVRVVNNKRVGNFSGTGAGKTISAILAANVTNSKLIVIACPNAVVSNWAKNIEECFPNTPVLLKEFNLSFVSQSKQKFIILNYEYFQQPNSAKKVKEIINTTKIDMIIFDEIHYTKQRTAENVSKRKEMIKNLVVEAENKNKNLKVIGMSATPVINNLFEGRTMIELITGKSYEDLDTKPNIPNCMKVYQLLTTLGTRQLPKYEMQLNEKVVEVDASEHLEEIKEKVGAHNILKLEQILTKSRLSVILKNLKPPTLIYTHMVDGIVDQLVEAIEEKGLSVGMYTGGDKTGYDQFTKGHIDVLIGSSAIGTGVDGLQNVCNQLILNVLPWTNAEYEQLKGRIFRQGQKRNVDVIIPVTKIEFDGETKSWCEDKLERIRFKKTLADAAVDGIVPEKTLRTDMQVFEDLRKWINRLAGKDIIDFERQKLISTLFTKDENEQVKRLRRYGDFSTLNAKWNISNSSKTYSRLSSNREEWVHYHELYRQNREKWIKTPYKEMINYYSKRNGLHIGDFGCGEAFLSEALSGKHTIYSFDHVAINENVIACDVANVPLQDETLDVVVFSLSLMGRNFGDYIREAARVLKLDGTIRIIESTNRFNDLDNFKNILFHYGFDDIVSKDMWKFTEIKGLRSDRKPKIEIKIKF